MRCWLALLLLCLIPLGFGRAAAQELVQGGLSIQVYAGYGVYQGFDGFALPVANSSLGRDWAGGTGYAWQVGRNASTVPIRLRIEHRFPYALRGTLEVISAHGFALEEDPLGHLTVLSRELLVPPSVPTTIVLTPRVCPPSEPGELTRLHLRLYLGTSETPQWESDVSTLQLEPAHLYSLYLDGPPGGITADPVNPGGKLGLAWPNLAEIWAPVFSFNHYILSEEHQQVTLAPLAARDWAFVIADLRQVAGWPAAEQEALKQFALGGGRLCLCGVGGRTEWRGLPLSLGAQPLGRGFVLPVQGGIDAVRPALTRWLEGELEEFTLFTGGTVQGQGIDLANLDGAFSRSEKLLAQYAPPATTAERVTHRGGFLHPVAAYRELCFSGALEPWDYPELILDQPDAAMQNTNLRQDRHRGDNLNLVPLAHLAHPPARPPATLYLAAALLPLLMLLGGIRPRRGWLALGATALGLAGALALWWGVEPQASRVLRLALWDADTQAQGVVQRELAATRIDQRARIALPVPPGALLRQIGWREPGNWLWTEDGDQASWQGEGGGQYVTLASEAAPTEGPDRPLRVACRRLSPTLVRVELDTSRLDPGATAWLITPLGIQAVSGGQARTVLELAAPQVGVEPGVDRLRTWAQALAGLELGPQSATIFARERMYALRLALRQAIEAGPRERLARLAQLELLQSPGGRLAWLNPQGVLLVPLAGTDDTAAEYLRLTFPLDGSGVAP